MKNIVCSNCNSKLTVKRGKRKTKFGNKQRYLCLECHRSFIEDDGFKRMRHKKEDVVRAIHLHNKGLSLFDVKDHIWQHDGVKVSREGIRKWTKNYISFLKSRKSNRANVNRKAAS